MQISLRIDDELHRAAKAQAGSEGVTLSYFIENVLRAKLARTEPIPESTREEINLRNEGMEALLKRTAHFRYGDRSSMREELGRE